MITSLLILLFIRPFISSLAYPYANLVYSILLLCWLALFILLKRLALKENKATAAAFFFIAALFFSLMLYNNRDAGAELYKYISGVLLFLASASLSYKDKSKIILSLTTAGLLISLFAIYQYFFGFRYLDAYIVKEKITNQFFLDYASQRRVFFPFVTPNTLGGYLAMVIPLALTRKNKLFFLVPLFLALVLTKSVGALLSLFLGLILYFCLLGRFKKKAVFSLLSLLVLTGVIFVARSHIYKEHLQPLFSTTMRLQYWQGTLEIIKARPFTGIGMGNFNLVFSRYSHNSYLQLWAEAGLLGIISFLWLVITALGLGLRGLREAPNKTWSAALICSACVFLLHNLIDFSFFLPEVSLIWWAILGLMLPVSSDLQKAS